MRVMRPIWVKHCNSPPTDGAFGFAKRYIQGRNVDSGALAIAMIRVRLA